MKLATTVIEAADFTNTITRCKVNKDDHFFVLFVIYIQEEVEKEGRALCVHGGTLSCALELKQWQPPVLRPHVMPEEGYR